MLAALTLAVVLGGAEPSVPALRDPTPAELMREGCVNTGLRREAFEQAARAHGWTPSRITRSSGMPGWNASYRAGRALVVMSGLPLNGGTDPSLASMCMVSMGRPQGNWLAELAALASELGMEPEGDQAALGGAEMRIWSKFGSETLSAAYRSSNRTVAVTLSRQIVTVLE